MQFFFLLSKKFLRSPAKLFLYLLQSSKILKFNNLTCPNVELRATFNIYKNMKLSSQMQLFDLKCFLPIGHISVSQRKDTAYHEYRQNRLCSTHGFCSIVLVPRPVFLHGPRTTRVSEKSSGHRGLPARREVKNLSQVHTGQGLPKYSGPCQRNTRLRIFSDFCQALIKTARQCDRLLYPEGL